MNLEHQLERLAKSAKIMSEAITTYEPRKIVSLVSGGNDSLTAFYVARQIGVSIDYILHVHTGTGVRQTREFVERWAKTTSVPLMLCEAGDAYERYVMRKGFFGKGISAHAMSYHVLKADPLRAGVAVVWQRQRDYPVLLLTGIRLDESDNRKYNFASQTVRRDPAAKNNIFVNLIEHWTQADCQELLSAVNAPRNPVSKALHRSAECMCGTMQSDEDRQLASIMYPEWGNWLNSLETKVRDMHGWGWGENMPKSIKQEKAGQMALPGFELCRHCLNGVVDEL